jgi:exonuclease SbcD
MTMIPIAHFSDLHYGAATLEEADRCFGAAVGRAIAENVAAAVITGDATDHGLDLHEPATVQLISQVKRLADHCPVLMLQGTFSHEPPGTLGVFRFLGARHTVHVSERIKQVVLTHDGHWKASEGWRFETLPGDARVLFSCVPALNKAKLAAIVGENAAIGEHLAVLLAGLAPGNNQARQQSIPTIAVSHGTVFGSLSEHGVPMAGFDHEFTTGALFGCGAQALMLGHIHRHQSWAQATGNGVQHIAYAGSIGRFHYGEEGEKGFLLWQVTANGAQFSLMPTPACRTVDIVFDGQPDLEEIRRAARDIQGARVRVRWTSAEEDRHGVDRAAITRLLDGAAEIRLEGRVVPVTRARAPGIAQLASLVDKVKTWASLTGVEPECVLDCLEALQQEPPADITQRVLGAR